jgi:predicted small secreted protein
MRETMNTIRLLRAVLILAISCLLIGCGTLHGWGQKSASTPATFGGGMSIPLGK